MADEKEPAPPAQPAPPTQRTDPDPDAGDLDMPTPARPRGPIVMDVPFPALSLPGPGPAVPSAVVSGARIEGTLFPPVPPLDLRRLPLDEEDFPVLLGALAGHPGSPPSALPEATPFLPGAPAAAPAAAAPGYVSPFRGVTPPAALDAPPPRSGPTFLLSSVLLAHEYEAEAGAAGVATSAAQLSSELLGGGATAAGPSHTPFQAYLSHPHLRERAVPASPPFGRGSAARGGGADIAGGSGDVVVGGGGGGGGAAREPFDHNEYLELGAEFPEEAQLPHAGGPGAAEMVAAFQEHMRGKGSAEDRDSMGLLIRRALPVRGVKMFQIRCELHSWFKDWARQHGAVPVLTQKEFAFQLVESAWYEDKLAAVLFMQEVLIAKRHISAADLPRFQAMFAADHVRVYKVCDHFAEKVLCYLARQGAPGPAAADAMLDTLFAWAAADDLWQARAALFALAQQARQVGLHERLMRAVKVMMERPEEEAKSMAGTALRSISDVDPVIVIEFLNRPQNLVNTSVTALQKACSRLTNSQKKHFKDLRREVCARRRR